MQRIPEMRKVEKNFYRNQRTQTVHKSRIILEDVELDLGGGASGQNHRREVKMPSYCTSNELRSYRVQYRHCRPLVIVPEHGQPLII